MPYGHASMLLLGEGSEATEPYNKYDKIRSHSFRSLQFDQKVRPLSFRPEKFDLFTATLHIRANSFDPNAHRHARALDSLGYADSLHYLSGESVKAFTIHSSESNRAR